MIPLFKLTETLEGREVKRNTLERAKLIAYDMVIRMIHDDACYLGTQIRRVHAWKGGNTQLRIRHGQHFVNIEKVK